MSIIRAIKQVLGLSVNPANNFVWDAGDEDGTLWLSRGNPGALIQDIMTVDAAGKVAFPQTPSASGVPAGAIQEFAMATIPSGWLAADGALVSRTTYAALFAAIGTVWGAGDGSTTFAVPDLRGMFRRGLGTNGNGTGPSNALGTFQAQQLNSHSHNFNLPAAIGAGTASGNSINAGSLTSPQTAGTQGQASGTIGTELRPSNYATLVCIKT